MFKRFVFWPLLAIVGIAAVGATSDLGSYAGAVIGLVISRRRWPAALRRRTAVAPLTHP